jgi:CobQ-like glutamine amidotransferase family enzyme/UDP-N-acetylmuramyl tripeptide synthase
VSRSSSAEADRSRVDRLRTQVAATATTAVSRASRRLRLGSGSVVGGRVGLAIDRDLLVDLAAGRPIALVSGTNGKTTTTRLLARAVEDHYGAVATSGAGANLPAGVVAALADRRSGPAVLEVDEAYLPAIADAVRPSVVVLLNLSRDQLDRVAEVRSLATRWRAALGRRDDLVVVANADDPLVAWAASAAPEVRWVAAGQRWRADAGGCPACDGQLDVDVDTWHCQRCSLRRPNVLLETDGDVLVWADGTRLRAGLGLPGQYNVANAAMAVAAAEALGVDGHAALAAMGSVSAVEGRYDLVEIAGQRTRLLLAKNPAGWTELLDLLVPGTRPIVLAVNAEVADGRDPSWLWDVAFERLAGHRVVASGRRARDLSLRLQHAGVGHLVVPDQLAAVAAAAAAADGRQLDEPGPAVDYAGNYTAFQQLRTALAGRSWRRRAASGPPVEVAPRPVVVLDRAAAAPDAGRAGTAAEQEVAATGRRTRRTGPSTLRVVVIHPDLLGTYGDGGNGQVLADRAAWRGMTVELLSVEAGDVLPISADVYLLGGGEDGPQVRSAELLGDGRLSVAVDRGACVLAVCAGFQILGRSFPGPDNRPRAGLGILDVVTSRRAGRRAVGEILARPAASPAHGDAVVAQAGRVLEVGGPLTGFENHGGATTLGEGVRPLAQVVAGVGNDGSGSEGAWSGRVVATYLHGPVLARNPALADALITLATGTVPEPLDDAVEHALRADRLAAVGWRTRRAARTA